MADRLTALDWKTGESGWTTEPLGKYVSMVARGDRILALDESGKLLLIHANPARFELLDSREVRQSPSWAHLAVAGDEVFVRDLTGITAYRWSTAAAASSE